MRQGGHRAASGGFTIVEVMIVLAVTGIMFVAAAILINGRQNKTEFTTAINDLQQQLQQIVNETISGYYPNNGNFICNGSATGSVTFTAGSNKQGTNGGCIFMGKALQFGLGGGAAASGLGILPLVGNQYQASTTTPITTVAQAKPRAVYPGTVEVNVPNTSITDYMENGLSVAASNNACGVGLGGICYTDVASGGKVATGIVAFVSGDSTGTIASLDSGSGLQAGSQQMSLYGASGSTPNRTLGQASDAIGGTSSPYVSKLRAASSASICIASATTNQSGLISIDNSLHVALTMKAGLTC
ncbi:MAG TPA: type II secretion system protein [Candidatus Saccharimonadia bacterium]|nr:type II secretion system protein [Candidatus Saccharimonadia bacterium]